MEKTADKSVENFFMFLFGLGIIYSYINYDGMEYFIHLFISFVSACIGGIVYGIFKGIFKPQ
jgi:hypothetical protein